MKAKVILILIACLAAIALAAPRGPDGPVHAESVTLVRQTRQTVPQQGQKGDPGVDRTGVTGRQGPVGQKGAQGQPGPTGPQGYQGNPGIDGNDGNDGADGADGADGKPGTDGVKGSTGPTGPPGPTGPMGPTGPAGGAGGSGASGAQGPIGAQGPQGDDACPFSVGYNSSCSRIPMLYGCYCFFPDPDYSICWDDANANAHLFGNVSQIKFRTQYEMDQFDHATLLSRGYSIWTAAYYNQTSSQWLWGLNDPVDNSLFCHGVPACASNSSAAASNIYYDGRGCLKGDLSSSERGMAYMGEVLVNPNVNPLPMVKRSDSSAALNSIIPEDESEGLVKNYAVDHLLRKRKT